MSLSPLAPVIEFPAADSLPQYASVEIGPLVIQTGEEYTATAERLKTITAFRRRVQDFFRPLKDKAHAAHKALCDEEKKALLPAEADEIRIKRALVAYTNQQERQRQVEAARLREEERIKEETRRLEEAAALERDARATGDVALQEQAEQIIDAPMPVMDVQPTTPAAPKVEGISYRETHRAEVTNLMALVKAVAAGQQPITLLVANQTALDVMARALKSALDIPGVRLVTDKTPVTRTR